MPIHQITWLSRSDPQRTDDDPRPRRWRESGPCGAADGRDRSKSWQGLNDGEAGRIAFFMTLFALGSWRALLLMGKKLGLTSLHPAACMQAGGWCPKNDGRTQGVT